MRHGAKKHEQSGDNRKVTYKRWQYARGLMLKLRDKHSVTEVSRIVKGHGQTPNWCAAALEYREQVTERDIKRMQQALGVPAPGSRRGMRKGAARLDSGGKGRLSKVLATLCNEHGWTRDLLGDALGVRRTTLSKMIHKGGGDTVLLRKAEELLEWMRAPLPHKNGAQAAESHTAQQEQEQEQATATASAPPLDAYHAFVVHSLASLYEVPEAEVVARMVAFAVNGPLAQQVAQAGADLGAWGAIQQARKQP